MLPNVRFDLTPVLNIKTGICQIAPVISTDGLGATGIRWFQTGSPPTKDGVVSARGYLLRPIYTVMPPGDFKLGGRPILSADLNVETARSERSRQGFELRR